MKLSLREPFPHWKSWTWMVSRFGLTMRSALRPVVVIRLRFGSRSTTHAVSCPSCAAMLRGPWIILLFPSSLDSSELNPGSQMMMMNFSQLQN